MKEQVTWHAPAPVDYWFLTLTHTHSSRLQQNLKEDLQPRDGHWHHDHPPKNILDIIFILIINYKVLQYPGFLVRTQERQGSLYRELERAISHRTVLVYMYVGYKFKFIYIIPAFFQYITWKGAESVCIFRSIRHKVVSISTNENGTASVQVLNSSLMLALIWVIPTRRQDPMRSTRGWEWVFTVSTLLLLSFWIPFHVMTRINR